MNLDDFVGNSLAPIGLGITRAQEECLAEGLDHLNMPPLVTSGWALGEGRS